MSGNVDISSLAIKVSSDGISAATEQLNALTEAATAAEGKSVILSKATQDSVQATTASSSAADKYAQKLLQQSDLLGKNNEYSAQYVAITKGATDAQLTTVSALGKNLDAWRALGEAQRQATLMDQQYNAEAARTSAANKSIGETLDLMQVKLDKSKGSWLALKAAQMGASQDVINKAKEMGDAIQHEAEKGEGAMGKLGLGTVGAKRELIVLAHEATQGNFSKMPGSFLVLAERMDITNILFSAMAVQVAAVAVVIGVLVYNIYQGHAQFEALGKSLTDTGNFADTSAESLNLMAQRMGSAKANVSDMREALALLSGTGRFTSEQLEIAGAVAVNMAKDSGASIEDITKKLSTISDDAYKFATEYQKSHHAMSESQIDLIKSLSDEGKQAQATIEVLKALNEEHDRMHPPKEAGAIMTWWKEWGIVIGKVSEYIKSIGIKESTFDQINDALRTRASLETQLSNAQRLGNSTLEFSLTNQLEANKKIINSLREVQDQAKKTADAQNAFGKTGDSKVALNTYLDSSQYQTKEVKRSLELAQENKAFTIAVAGYEQGSNQYEEALERHKSNVAQIKKSTTEKTKDTGLENATEAAQMAALNVEMNYQKLRYDAEVNFQNKLYAAGDITEQEKIDRERTAITAKIAAVAEGYVKEFDLLGQYNGKDETARKNHEAKVDGIRKKAADDMSSMLSVLNSLSLEEDKSSNAAYAASLKEVEALEKQAATLADNAKVRGVNKSVIDEEEVALAAKNVQLVEELLNTSKNLGIGQDELDLIEKRIELLKRELTARQSIASSDRTKEVADAAAKQATAYQSAWNASYKSIEDGLYNAISNGGGNAVQKLLKDMKNWFARLILSPIINPIASFGSSLINGGSGVAGQGGLSTLSSLSGISNTVNSIYSLFQGTSGSMFAGGSFFGGASVGAAGGQVAAESGLMSSLGESFGSSAASAFGTEAAGTLVSGIGTALPYVGAAIAAYSILKSGLSMGDKQLGNQTVTGNLGTDNLTRNVPWTQQGGFLRSDRSGTWSYGLKDSTAVADGVAYKDNASASSDTALLKVLTDSYTAVKKASTDYATSLGLNAASIASRTDSINLAIGATAAETQANALKLFNDISDKIATDLLGSLSSLSVGTETSSATLARLSSEFTSLNVMMKALGSSTYAVTTDGIKAADALVTLLGGLQQAQTTLSAYYDAYYTTSEKTASGLAKVSDMFVVIGQVMPNSRDQLRQWIDAAKAAGNQDLYAKLMNLTGAFAAVVPAIEDTTKSLASIASERKSLQDQLLQLNGTQAQLDSAKLNAVDASNMQLQAEVLMAQRAATAKTNLATAYNTESTALKTTITTMQTFATSIAQFKSSLAIGSLSTLDPNAKYAEAKAQYDKTLASAKLGDTTAQGQLQAVATAFLTQSQIVNASSQQYAADYATVQQSNDELIAATNMNADIAQQQLDAMIDQVSKLTTINTSVLSVEEAIKLVQQYINPAVQDVPQVTTQDNTASILANQLKVFATTNATLTAELAGLRADQQAQTAQIVSTNIAVNTKAADTIAGAVSDSSQYNRNYSNKEMIV